MERLNGLLAALAGNAGLRRLEICDPSGTIRLTSEADSPADLAIAEPDAPTFAAAAGGLAQAGILDTPPATAARSCARCSHSLTRPARRGRRRRVARRRADPRPIADVQRDILLVTLAAASSPARSCSSSSDPRSAGSADRPTLLDATERDPLTGR